MSSYQIRYDLYNNFNIFRPFASSKRCADYVMTVDFASIENKSQLSSRKRLLSNRELAFVLKQCSHDWKPAIAPTDDRMHSNVSISEITVLLIYKSRVNSLNSRWEFATRDQCWKCMSGSEITAKIVFKIWSNIALVESANSALKPSKRMFSPRIWVKA